MHKVAGRLKRAVDEDDEFDDSFFDDLSHFIDGSLSQGSELIQLKRDLGRTKMAEEIKRRRKAYKNTPLQSGGVLTMAEGREMVAQRHEDDVAKARKLVEATDLKARNARKRCFKEAAKEARK